jgi:hypothetical protein
MKNNMKLIPVLGCCIILGIWGCKNATTKDADVDVFNDVFKGDSLKVNGTTLFGPEQLNDPWVIRTMDTLLLVANKKGDTVLDVYSTSGKLIKRMVQRGKGTLNIRMAGYIQPDYIHDQFYLYDLFAHKILRFSVPDMLKDSAYHPELYAMLDRDSVFNNTFDKAYVNGDGFIAESRVPDGRLVTFNKKLDDRRYFLSFPPRIDTSLTDQENSTLYSMGIAFNQQQTKMAMATYAAGLLNIMNVTQEGLDSVWSAEIYKITGLKRVKMDNGNFIAHSDAAIAGYSDICATEKYIYAIFSGKRLRDGNNPFSNIVHVLTWDGKKRFKILLNKEINRLTASQDNKTLYGLSTNADGEPEINAFPIGDHIK